MMVMLPMPDSYDDQAGNDDNNNDDERDDDDFSYAFAT